MESVQVEKRRKMYCLPLIRLSHTLLHLDRIECQNTRIWCDFQALEYVNASYSLKMDDFRQGKYFREGSKDRKFTNLPALHTYLYTDSSGDHFNQLCLYPSVDLCTMALWRAISVI